MGVFEQRYRSFCIHISLIFSLAFAPLAPVTALGGPTSAQAVEAPLDSRRDPRTAVRLPPALEAFFLVLIGTANLQRPGAVEFLDHSRLSRLDQLMRFKVMLQEIVRIYRERVPYTGPPIETLGEYVQLVEPTRVHSGSLRGDLDKLFERLSARGQGLPAAALVKKGQFSNSVTEVEAELFEYDRTNRLQQVLELIVGAGTGSPGIVATVLTGALGVVFTARGASSALRSLADRIGDEVKNPAQPPTQVSAPAVVQELENPQVAANPPEVQEPLAGLLESESQPPAGLNSQQRKKWRRDRENQRRQSLENAGGQPANGQVVPVVRAQAPVAPKPTAVPTATTDLAAGGSLLTLAAVGRLAGAGADAIDDYQKLTESEGRIIDFIEQLSEMDTAEQERILNTFHSQLHNVVIPQIERIGTVAAQAPEIRAADAQDGRVTGVIQLFFNEYLRLLPSDLLKDIILDILRAPFDTTDYQSLSIVLRHYPPIAQQFFQTISREAGLGNFAQMFKQIRDDGWEVPLDQIESILKEDPNHYPLTNIRLSGKAGKLFQLVYADYTDPATGEVVPVAVRVMKPGVDKLLDTERVILRQLANQLSQALRRSDGTGPSARRLEQLIDLIHRNLKEELRVDLTVKNQNEGAERLKRRLEIDLQPHGKAILNIAVPRAYPALPGSKVMVMERVTSVPSMKTLEQYYPELPKEFARALMDLSVEEILLNPMGASLDPKQSEGRFQAEKGFMHTDLHSGNFLFQVANENTDVPEYSVSIIDFGLVAWITKEQVSDLAKLAVGASYNSVPFLVDALWSLRDPAMEKWDRYHKERAQTELHRLVQMQVSDLNRTGQFWPPADWVKYVWMHEAIDLPGWAISLEQGFRAVTSSYAELGLDAKQRERQEAALAERYKKLFYNFMKKNARHHKGWRAVYVYEAKQCMRRLLGFSRQASAAGP